MPEYTEVQVVLACLLTPVALPLFIVASRAYLHFAPSTGYRMRSRLVLFRDYINYNFYVQVEVPWQLFQVVISFISAGLYVVDTYQERTSKWSALHTTDGVLTLFFLVDYLWAFLMARDKLGHFFSLYSIIDIYSIVPYLVLTGMTDLNSSSLVIRAMNGFRILRVLRSHRILEFTKTDLQRQLLIVVLTIIGFLFCFTCLVELIEDTPEFPLTMWDSLWFVAVSSTTVGYGDFVPNTQLGRIFVMVIIFIGIVLIPLQTGKLISIIQALPKHAGSLQKSSDEPHVVIIVGSPATMDAAATFLREFYHRDNELHDHKVVILSSVAKLTPSLDELLAVPFFEARVTYLSGSPLASNDLVRANAAGAKAIFIAVDQLAADSTREDSSAILKAIALSEYVSHVRVYTQTLHRRNIGHMAAAGADVILCVDEIKMGIFAQSCISPGLCTLVTNLVRSYSDVDGTTGWTHEYAYGFSQEIYVEVCAHDLVGLSFAQAAHTIYDRIGAMAFGVFVSARGAPHVWLNPGYDYTIAEGDRLFIIAQSKKALVCDLFVSPASSSASLALTRSDVDFHAANATLSDVSVIDIVPEWAVDNEYLVDPYSLEESLVTNPPNNVWANVYTILPPAAARSEAEITNSHAAAVAFTGHIIVCGTHSGLASLIIALRSKRLSTHVPIVLLSPIKPAKELWFVISRFPDVFWVKGSAAVFTDLYRVNVGDASRILVLANSDNPSDDELMLDADTIFSLRSIRHKFESTSVQVDFIAELAHGSNTKFLAPSAADAPSVLENDPGLAAAYSVSRPPEASPLFDTDDPAFASSITDYTFLPQFASGSVFTSPIIDSLLCQSFIKPYIIDIIRQMLGLGTDACHAMISSQIFQVPAPRALVHRTYDDLVAHYLLTLAVIPIGLYRLEPDLGHRYVYTNPDGSTRVLPSDRVFILSRGEHHHAPPPATSPSSSPTPLAHPSPLPTPDPSALPPRPLPPLPPHTQPSLMSQGMTRLPVPSPLPDLDDGNALDVSQCSLNILDLPDASEFGHTARIHDFVHGAPRRPLAQALARARSRASTAPTRLQSPAALTRSRLSPVRIFSDSSDGSPTLQTPSVTLTPPAPLDSDDYESAVSRPDADYTYASYYDDDDDGGGNNNNDDDDLDLDLAISSDPDSR